VLEAVQDDRAEHAAQDLADVVERRAILRRQPGLVRRLEQRRLGMDEQVAGA
jgi:hypothetical protein